MFRERLPMWLERFALVQFLCSLTYGFRIPRCDQCWLPLGNDGPYMTYYYRCNHCRDCGIDTAPYGKWIQWQDYMVHDHVWESGGLGPAAGKLCFTCLERRLGRSLVKADFRNVPANDELPVRYR